MVVHTLLVVDGYRGTEQCKLCKITSYTSPLLNRTAPVTVVQNTVYAKKPSSCSAGKYGNAGATG